MQKHDVLSDEQDTWCLPAINMAQEIQKQSTVFPVDMFSICLYKLFGYIRQNT